MSVLINLSLTGSLWFLAKWLEILDLIEVRNAPSVMRVQGFPLHLGITSVSPSAS